MIVPDANLLIYAYDRASADHPAARDWWQGCLSSDEPILLCHVVVFAFTRIITSTRLMTVPLSMADAAKAVQSWLDQPQVQLIIADSTHHHRVFDLLAHAGTAGNLTTDAQIAALALQKDATVLTNDSDFRRFSGLRWHNPLTGNSGRNP